ncbi:MAG: sterol desaturase family protein [Bacteroidetes bacterium]|nr:sterol desaturase family protein [Bacteroidota bacterium]
MIWTRLDSFNPTYYCFVTLGFMPQTFVTLPPPNIPKEQKGNVIYGIFGHLGSPFTYILFLAIFGVTLLTAAIGFLIVSAIFMTFTLIEEKKNASMELPKYTTKEFIDGLTMVFYKGILVGGGFITIGWFALSFIPLYGKHFNNWWLIIGATFLLDLAYYWIHRLMSHSRGNNPILKYYRKKHAAHHSVSELDFLRGNQSSLVDTAISQFQPSLIFISYFMGMDLASTWVAYALILMLQATDHTSVTYNIGWLKYIFMDNHAHKLHHCKRGNLINHAAAFSIYDRLWGTYYEDWNLCSNYLHHHRIALPIKRIEKESTGELAVSS